MPPLEIESSSNATFRLDNEMCRARDEAANLRNELCQLRIRLEEVEDERKYNAAKANELQELLKNQKKEHVHEVLVKKSLQVAEMSMSLDRLRTEINSLKTENENLKQARRDDRTEMEKLSGVLRSLQCASYESDGEEEEEEETVLTPEKALDMTLKNMKFHIEVLEDERQKLSLNCKAQQSQITKLEKEGELNNLKVEMLEELFRCLNQARIDAPTTKPGLKKATSSPDLFAEERPTRSRARARRPSKYRSDPSKKSSKISVNIGALSGAYTGPLVDGKPNGVGTIRFINGDTYLGEVLDGQMHGKGTLYYKSKGKGIARGVFEKNEFLGEGKKVETRHEASSQ